MKGRDKKREKKREIKREVELEVGIVKSTEDQLHHQRNVLAKNIPLKPKILNIINTKIDRFLNLILIACKETNPQMHQIIKNKMMTIQ